MAPITAAFTADRVSATVPFTTHFTDQSTYPAGHPITSWAWDFGDGGESSDENTSHTYTLPGTYTVTLTVTNDLGSSSASMTIQANEAPVSVMFANTCYFPANVNVADTFTPIIDIQNTGGPGNIYLYYVVNGKQVSIWTSQAIAARTTISADLGAHNIAYFLGYTPTEPEVDAITFYTGTVGQAASGTFGQQVGVSVGTTPTPTPTPTPGMSKTVLYALGGVAAVGLGLIAYSVLRGK